MRWRRWMLLSGLLAFCGCDLVLTGVMYALQDDPSKDDPPLVVVVSEGPEYRAWVAWLPDDPAGDAAKAALIASGGQPSAPVWTLAGSGNATTVIDAPVDPNSVNAVLVQVTSAQNYNIDSVEILDSQDRVLEHAAGTVWSNQMTFAPEVMGPPDGGSALSEAAEGAAAFIFTRYAGPIDKLRINAAPVNGPPTPGDVQALAGYLGYFNEKPGGMEINPSGLIHLTLSIADYVKLVRYGLDGVFVDYVVIDTGVQTTEGSHSVALNSSGQIFTAATIADGRVLVGSFDPGLSSKWSRTLSSGKDDDRVEANGIAVDDSGHVVVAGGMNSSQGLHHWLAKLDGLDGDVLFDHRQYGGLSDAYWHGLATAPGGLIHTTGNATTGPPNDVHILTARFDSSGSGLWEHSFADGDLPDDGGRSIARDAAGNLFVAGFLGATVGGRNSVLMRYGVAGDLSAIATFNGLSDGDDEILDVALDADGSIYAVGYETVAGQGENMWIRKYDASFSPVWTRTHHGGFGNDRAVSVAIHGQQLVVAGFESNAAGQTKMALRVYAK